MAVSKVVSPRDSNTELPIYVYTCSQEQPGGDHAGTAVTVEATVTATVTDSATDTVTDTDTVTADPHPRPSGTYRPSQRRTSSVVVWRKREGQRPRCSRERRPPTEPGEVHRSVLPEECPAWTLCGRRRGTVSSHRHNVMPGTSRWGALPAAPVAEVSRRQ